MGTEGPTVIADAINLQVYSWASSAAIFSLKISEILNSNSASYETLASGQRYFWTKTELPIVYLFFFRGWGLF